MQRIGANGRKNLINFIAPALLILLIVLDQLSKTLVQVEYVNDNTFRIDVIEGFFYFTRVLNSGAAWSFLSGEAWAQIFFKILTAIVLIALFAYYTTVCKKGYKFLRIALVFVFAGTIGNFIDRLVYNRVVDFIGFTFGGWDFPVFNIADICLVVGVVMVIVHYLFLDKNAVFKKKNAKEQL